MSVAANLTKIRGQLKDAPVTVIAVSKYVGLPEIKEAIAAGVTEFGESRIQDALKKQEELPAELQKNIRWHFIGHLQSNKAKKAVGRFALIHSVDSFHLAKELSEEAVKQGLEQAILLQVKILNDPAKSGFSPQILQEEFSKIHDLAGLKIEGLMTMTPLTDDKEIWRQCFSGLKQLKLELESTYHLCLPELSMGMSDDYLVAVTCGATLLRIGRAIFENSEN
ncbi:MAG: YggS family pyridoxal phosphate-dependent enzyme [Candidatus Obscuribacterales bacterium]|nr:YggS family pyridoxal phosphate-dependent enzyme [Candidatus Obscuribacterales bacterium]